MDGHCLTLDFSRFLMGAFKEHPIRNSKTRRMASRHIRTCYEASRPFSRSFPRLLALITLVLKKNLRNVTPRKLASSEIRVNFLAGPVHILMYLMYLFKNIFGGRHHSHNTGTWNTARSLNRHESLRDIPRVHLTNSSRSVFGGARKFENKERVCTAGALHHVLQELGGSEQALDPLGEALNHCFDMYSAQIRRERLMQ
jgi:hypothetical protein